MAKRSKRRSSSTAVTAGSTPGTAGTTLNGRDLDEPTTTDSTTADEVDVIEPDSAEPDTADTAQTDTAQTGDDDGDQDSEPAPAKRTRRAKKERKPKAPRIGNPRWFVPVMLGLFVIGLIWIVVFYLSQTEYPIPHFGYKNLLIGFGILLVGFGMSTRWK